MNKYPEGTNVVCMQNDIDALQEDLQSCDEVINELISNNINILYMLQGGYVDGAIAMLLEVNNKYKQD